MTEVVLSTTLIWEIVLAIAIGTVLSQMSFIVLLGWVEAIPDWIEHLLLLVPPAALAALVFPSLLIVDGGLSLSNPRLPAGVVALRTGNLLATVVIGLLAFWAMTFAPLVL